MTADVDRIARTLVEIAADSAVRSLALALVAVGAIVILRRRRAAVRLGIWTVLLCGALALPVLGIVLPAWRWTAPAIQLVEAWTPPSGPSAVDAVAMKASLSVPSPAASHGTPLSWWTIGAAIYGAGVILLALHAYVGWLVSRRLRVASQEITDADALATLSRCSAGAGLTPAPRLAESRQLFVPVTMSVARPVIVLPDDWREWPAGRLDAVLAHELAHVARRDALTQRISLFYRATTWFSPLSWWLHRHIADLADEACDEAALESGIDRTTYAAALLEFFTRLHGKPQRADWHLAMARRGDADATRRVERILSWKGGRMTRSRLVLTLITLAATPVVALTASASLTPAVVRFTIPAVHVDRPTAVVAPAPVPLTASAVRGTPAPTIRPVAPLVPEVQAPPPDGLAQLIATLKDPALTVYQEQHLARTMHSGVVQVFEVQTVAAGLHVDRPFDSIQKDVPTLRIMVDVGAADPQGRQYYLAFETTDVDRASKLRKGDRVRLSGNLAQFVSHREGYNNLPDKWLIFDQVAIGGTVDVPADGSRYVEPSEPIFASTNFPGSTSGDLNNAKALYALLTGRVSSVEASREPQDDFAKGAYEADAPGVVAPRVTKDVMPKYTVDAMRAKIQGTVIVEVIILADGTVGKARVKSAEFEPSANQQAAKQLLESALVAAKQWTFTPGTINGRPVLVHQMIMLEFRLH